MNRLLTLLAIAVCLTSIRGAALAADESPIRLIEKSAYELESRNEIFVGSLENRDAVVNILRTLYPDAIPRYLMAQGKVSEMMTVAKFCQGKEYAPRDFTIEVLVGPVEPAKPFEGYDCKSTTLISKVAVKVATKDESKLATALIESLFPEAKQTPLSGDSVSYLILQYKLVNLPSIYVIDEYIKNRFFDEDKAKLEKQTLETAIAGKVAVIRRQKYIPPEPYKTNRLSNFEGTPGQSSAFQSLKESPVNWR